MRESAGIELCPWDVSSESEGEEDWMFSSIKMYKQLHMFHLSLTASHMALTPNGSALALADSKRGHLEVYNLPGKLVAGSGEKEGLTSNRDFGLVSGTVECPGVGCVESISASRLLTTSSLSQTVSLWSCQPAEDLIQLTGEVCRCDFQPKGVHLAGENEVVVWGEQSLARAEVTGLGLDRRKVGEEVLTVRTAGQISWSVGRQGELSTIDWRQSSPALQLRLQQGPLSQSCILPGAEGALVVARSEDSLRLWDLRSPNILQERTLSGEGGLIVAGSDHIVLSQGAKVEVLSLSLQPVFSHQAHKAPISSLLTHPTVSNLVISADTANRLQAWVFNRNHLTLT